MRVLVVYHYYNIFLSNFTQIKYMNKPFFNRLFKYYKELSSKMIHDASSASIFANKSDIGVNRENVYLDFLEKHLPSSCCIKLGGFLFDLAGKESCQLDVLVFNNNTPMYDLHGKSFGPIDGCISAISIKSNLDKAQLIDSLEGFKKLPDTSPIKFNSLYINGPSLENISLPLKIIYAKNGISGEKIFEHLRNYYLDNPEIPLNKKPDIIHVGNEFFIYKPFNVNSKNVNPTLHETGKLSLCPYYLMIEDADVAGIAFTINGIQRHAFVSQNIYYDYTSILLKTMNLI